MMYDLIEVEPKLNKKKVAGAIIIVLLAIALIVFIILKHTKKNEDAITNSTAENEIINEVEEKTAEETQEAEVIVRDNPNYTEVGRELMSNIYHSEEKIAYLTFDDGPSKSVTPLLLDLLKQENIKATFFVLGSRAELNGDLIKREYDEGHYIANHGYSHIYGNIYQTPESVLEEYIRTRDIIKNILNTDYDGHLFRFPGGSSGGKYNSIKVEAKKILDENNIAYVDWNALSNDAAGAKTKEAIIQNTKDTVGTKNSVVILMHDAGDKILTYESLPEIIAYLREQGYNFKNFYDIMK